MYCGYELGIICTVSFQQIIILTSFFYNVVCIGQCLIDCISAFYARELTALY